MEALFLEAGRAISTTDFKVDVIHECHRGLDICLFVCVCVCVCVFVFVFVILLINCVVYLGQDPITIVVAWQL